MEETIDLSPAEKLLEELKKRGLTVGTAESCTGGNIAHEITLIPGSSEAMMGGVVSYSNSVKSNVLGVPAEMIEQNGAVSIPVAEAMARGARKCLGCDVAMATSGIAGPGGGTELKPVGTVCFAVSGPGDALYSTTLHLSGNRAGIIESATREAIQMTLRAIDTTTEN